MAEEKSVKMVIHSDLKDVYLIDMLIESLCSIVHLPDDRSFWIKLCAVEAVNNCIIHAYRKETDHEVEVIFTLAPDRIRIEVRDTGLTIPEKIIEESVDFQDADDISEVSENGRGIVLIHEIMDTVEYVRKDNKNCLIMTKKLF